MACACARCGALARSRFRHGVGASRWGLARTEAGSLGPRRIVRRMAGRTGSGRPRDVGAGDADCRQIRGLPPHLAGRSGKKGSCGNSCRLAGLRCRSSSPRSGEDAAIVRQPSRASDRRLRTVHSCLLFRSGTRSGTAVRALVSGAKRPGAGSGRRLAILYRPAGGQPQAIGFSRFAAGTDLQRCSLHGVRRRDCGARRVPLVAPRP